MSRHIAVVLCCTLGMLACSPDTPEQPAVQSAAQDNATASSAVYARVNQQVITRSQVDERVALLRDGGALHRRETALRQLIDEQLISQAAQEQGLELPDGTLDDAISRFRARFPDLATYQRFLDDIPGKEATLRARFHRQWLLQQLANEKSSTPISDEQVAKFYRQHPEQFARQPRVAGRGILVPVPEWSSASFREAASRQAQRIHSMLVADPDRFADMAREYSGDLSARTAGLLPGIEEGDGTGLYEAMAALSPGQISDPVRTARGFWIVQRIAARPAKQLALNDAAGSIRTQIMRRESVARESATLLRLRDEAQVERLVPLVVLPSAMRRESDSDSPAGDRPHLRLPGAPGTQGGGQP